MSRKTRIFLLTFIFIISLCSFSAFIPSNVSAALSTSTYGKIHFINVSNPDKNQNADAILIESKGKLCLIDSGNPPTYGSGDGLINYSGYDGKRVVDYIKGIGGTHIDYIIATHSHSDHIGGMKQVAESSLVNSTTKYYYRKQYSDDPTGKNATTDKYNTDKYGMNNEYFYNTAMTAIKKKTTNLIDVTDNTNITITLGNFNLKLLNTESWANRGYTGTNTRENNNSIVVLATIGSKKALLTADMEMVDERRLVSNGSIGKIDILKLGHHGCNTATSYELIDTTRPNAVIETGRADYYPPERNTIAMKYILDKGYVSNIYNTSKIPKGAIIADFTSSSYTLKLSDSSKTLASTAIKLSYSKSGSWIKITQENKSDRYVWYLLDSDGKAKTGWQKSGSYWYSLTNYNGAMRTGWFGDYYLTESTGGSIPEGAMVTGWLDYNNKTYYLNNDENDSTFELGQCVTGFRKLGGKWYYFNRSADTGTTKCSMNTSTSRKIGGKTFSFKSNGECTSFTGFATKPTNTNYCKATTYNGKSQTITKAAATGYAFSNNSQSAAGTYTITAALSKNYLWSDYTSSNVTFSCAISPANISSSTITAIADQQYTGSAITPNPVVKITLADSTKTLTKGTDYTVSYTNNKNVGTATIKITGKGNYTGTKTTTFKIIDENLSFIDSTNMSVNDNKVYILIVTGNSINKNTLFNNIVNNSNKTLYNKDNNEVTSIQSVVGTGYSIKTGDKSYPIVVYGDIDGTGTINANDMALVYKKIKNSVTLTGLNLEAADIDKSGSVNANDLRNIYIRIAR